MSRTLKDRPNWVENLHPTQVRNKEVEEYHNHARFGKPIYKNQTIHDQHGRLVTQEVTYTSHRYNPVTFAFETRNYTVNRPKTIKVLVGYVKDHCTVDEPHDKKVPHKYDLNPCHRYVVDRYGNRPLNKTEKRIYHGSRKTREKLPLKQVTKWYNNGENVDGYDNPEINTRTNMHWGYWN